MRSNPPAAIFAAAFLLAACSGLEQEQAVSDCGGFGPGSQQQALGEEPAEPAYCAAEALLWEYDSGAQRLKLTDARVLLNCCGDHEIEIEEAGTDAYRVVEKDGPESAGRCDCMCVYDFRVEAEGIASRSISLELVREVTDGDGGERRIWQGSLDLAAGSGRIVIDAKDVGPWCGQ